MLATSGADVGAPRFPELTGNYLGQKPPGRVPEEFAVGIVGGHFNVHSSIVFSPDGREAYWSESIPPRDSGYGTGRTLASRRDGDRWTYPQRAMAGSLPLEDVPVVSADGKKIYDMARRPLQGGSTAGKENIWVADRTANGWGEPRPLDPVVNALPQHWQFWVDREGAVYFSSNWKGATGLFRSRLAGGRYAEPESLAGQFEAARTGEMPFVAPDGGYMLFSKDADLWVSFRGADGRWGSALSLGAPVNTPGRESLPVASPDGRYLFFVRGYQVYWVDAGVIEELRLRK